MSNAKNPQPRAGLAVDGTGQPVIDPTENVKALTEAEARRQDDLRNAHGILMSAEINHLKDIMALRAEYSKELALKESGRVDAIRQVDQLNVSTAAAVSAAAISTLASTTMSTAETLRNSVVASAQTIASQTATIVSAITERLAALEKSSYEGQGKSALADPAMVQLLTEMKTLREDRAKAGGAISTWSYLVAAFGAFLAFASVAIAGFGLLRP